MIAAESSGLAFDFTDMSAQIKDTTTPANNYSSGGQVSAGALVGPGGKLTYTGQSLKLTRQRSGTYAFQAHNLYLNSAAPANQSITVVAGATYSITITGSVSVAASGAATATWTAGTVAFTAATTTLTLGSTSGAGTVHLRRTPSVDSYIATAGAAIYDLPYEWDAAGASIGILVEQARTNLFLNSAVGVTQNVTTSATAYALSFFGTGTITLSGTSIAGPLVGTGAGDRVSLSFTPTAGTLTLTVSGTCTRVQIEAGIYATSPIETFGASVARAADNIRLATTAFPYNQPAGTVFIEHYRDDPTTNLRLVGLSTGATRVVDVHNNSTKIYSYNGTANVSPSNDAANAAVNRYAAAYATTSYAAVLNGGTPGALATAAVNTADTLYIGQLSTGLSQPNSHIRKIMYLPRRMSNADMQALTA